VTSKPDAAGPHGAQPQYLSLAIDLGPLIVFFAAYWFLGIFWATGALMAATVVSMALSRILLGRVSASLIMTTVLVVGFGALTFWFNDPSFIKMKPTIINLLFAAALVGGLATGRNFLKSILGHALSLTTEGWRKLTIRWVFFFIVMAAVNEVVWRNFSEGTWASFKVFGILPLTMIFFVCQLGFIQRHQLPEDRPAE
jgi:intracellular septation protein